MASAESLLTWVGDSQLLDKKTRHDRSYVSNPGTSLILPERYSRVLR